MKQYINYIKKMNIIEIIFYFFLCIILFFIISNLFKKYKHVETFETNHKKTFITKKDHEVYDDFYSELYDHLVYSKIKNDWEIGTIINKTGATSKSKLLDVGSGTGHHINEFTNKGIESIGIDISPSMTKLSKKKYPNCNFINGNIEKSITFTQNSFTHITCLYFTIYDIKDKRTFFMNCYDWLIPGGHLILHLVDRNTFDPIIPVGKPNKKHKDNNIRNTSTLANIGDYQYKSDFHFDLNNNKSILYETFKNKKNGDIRKQEHTFYMPSQRYILSIARDCGFILIGNYEMSECMYKGQYIYILQKPE